MPFAVACLLFRSPRPSARIGLPSFRSKQSAPRARSRRRTPRCLSCCLAAGVLISPSGSAKLRQRGMRVWGLSRLLCKTQAPKCFHTPFYSLHGLQLTPITYALVYHASVTVALGYLLLGLRGSALPAG
eukprot:3894622-Pleurochrysis_carterae.AAC.3